MASIGAAKQPVKAVNKSEQTCVLPTSTCQSIDTVMLV